MVGGALMREAGLNYLLGDVSEHSILFLVTNDGCVEWRDMLAPLFNDDLTDEMIKGKKKDGLPIKVADIVAFSKNPKPEGLVLDIVSEKYGKKLNWVKEEQGGHVTVTVFEPEHGCLIQVLHNTGNVLYTLNREEEAIEAYRQVIALNPKYANTYYGLGNALSILNREEEAIGAYRQAIALEPKAAHHYNNLGNSFYSIGRYKDKEAIEAYQKFIELADKQKDDYLIKQAEDKIAELRNK